MNEVNIFLIVGVLIVLGLWLVLFLAKENNSETPKTLKTPKINKIVSDNLLIGKWLSLDDCDSMIEFDEDNKIDYYQGEKISEDKYDQERDNIVVKTEEGKMEYKIIEISSKKLILIYLARGNTLSYKKVN